MTSPLGRPAQWNSLDDIARDVRDCRKCRLCEGRTNAVPGEGSPSAAVMFIGEGPGRNEDEQGRPFVGRAGQLLDEMLGLVPLRRADVFITNVVKCRPPDNREPEPDEVAACWPYLEAQISLLKPRVIATLGRHSLVRFFPDARISQEHGKLLRWKESVVFPLYHPAAALRSGAVMEALATDVRALPRAVLESLRGVPPAARQAGPPPLAAQTMAAPQPPAGPSVALTSQSRPETRPEPDRPTQTQLPML